MINVLYAKILQVAALCEYHVFTKPGTCVCDFLMCELLVNEDTCCKFIGCFGLDSLGVILGYAALWHCIIGLYLGDFGWWPSAGIPEQGPRCCAVVDSDIFLLSICHGSCIAR